LAPGERQQEALLLADKSGLSLLAICDTGGAVPVETCVRRCAGIAARIRVAGFVL